MADQRPGITDMTAGEAELEALYRRHHGDVLLYVRRTFGVGPPDPEDVVQVVFERFALLGSAERILNPKAFLFRIARNYVIDERRRQIIRSEYAVDTQATADRHECLDGERILDAKTRVGLLERAIEALDPRAREMLLLSRIHGLSSAEIARRQNCSPTLVKSIIAKALVACHHAVAGGDER